MRWSDTYEVTLVSRLADAHIHHLEHGEPEATHDSRQDTAEAAAVSPSAPPSGATNPVDIGRRVAA
ncbi:hypothetical protein [Streptomyces mirabilis]|uniref:hypothetical protein n=1 Tax=Streptomyces mirabilis TaxID=68239 RepID=UPI0036CE9EE3